MTSLLRNWDDVAFRKSILLLGSEEGPFYEPAGKHETKCFVVVTIRNSPIETLQSDSYLKAGLSYQITNADIKAITGEAIRFFNTLDFDTLCQEAKKSPKSDLYRDLSLKYPIAFNALQQCANTSAKVFEYEKAAVNTPYEFFECEEKFSDMKSNNEENAALIESLFDGYSPEIDAPLMKILQERFSAPNGTFITGAFKMVSRNPEKLMRVLEYLLTHGGAFVSCNYYLENGHVERRIKPLKAPHTTLEVICNISQLKGLGLKHTEALKLYLKHNS